METDQEWFHVLFSWWASYGTFTMNLEQSRTDNAERLPPIAWVT
jgi:hypothetical protein